MGMYALIKKAKELKTLAREVLSSRRSKVKIVVDENQFGIIQGLKKLGYNDITTFPSGTPDQVIHDSINKMRRKTKEKPILLVTDNANDFNQSKRGTNPLYTIIYVPASYLAEKVPCKIDVLVQKHFTSFVHGVVLNLATMK